MATLIQVVVAVIHVDHVVQMVSVIHVAHMVQTVAYLHEAYKCERRDKMLTLT